MLTQVCDILVLDFEAVHFQTALFRGTHKNL